MNPHTAHTRIPLPSRQDSAQATPKTHWGVHTLAITLCLVASLALLLLPSHSATLFASYGGLDWDNPAPLLTGIVAPAYLFLLTHRLNSGIVRWASAGLSTLTILGTLAFIFYGDLALKTVALEPDLMTPDSIARDDYPLVILLTSLMSIVILFIITLNARPQRVSSFRHSAVLPVSALLTVSGLLVAGRALLTGELVWTASLVSLAICGFLLPAVLGYAGARYASGSTRLFVLFLSFCQFFLSLVIISSSDALTGTPPDNGFANYHTGQILNAQMAVVMILLSMVSLYMLSTHERRHSHE
ncbi:hypothetical protein B9G54_02840 [Alloscardovia macacae]|uniref:Uncharacterized protein n=1 Tax=Alloscardovia macacae TaxID=1160091 RepID=A0A1Y2SVH7_9BIFI|nr:hypothetical protein [Alloscardovia macacae]OTA26982.1 hypothetical protein B9G54_02840 [Alloscardovia macacae]OTA30030.1 hypothetical protein B9T39_01310 [Alloscardovia macacae]